MKYCINYNQKTERLECINEADEWTIKYNSKDETLLEFLKLHTDKRINLWITNGDFVSIDFLQELSDKFDNLYFKLPLNSYLEEIENNEVHFRYFFDEYINNWDTLIGVLQKSVTDVYITEDLGFELDKVAATAAKYGAQVRVFPNVAQSEWRETPGLKKFFIRPEDVEAYEDYVDVMEFYGDDSKVEVYYRVYAIDKKWFGRLDELIIDLNSDIDSRFTIPRFAEKRIRCGKSCLKGGRCRRCEHIQDLSHSLEESGLIVKIDK